MSKILTQEETDFIDKLIQSCRSIIQSEQVQGKRISLITTEPVESMLHAYMKDRSGSPFMVFTSINVKTVGGAIRIVELRRLDDPFMSEPISNPICFDESSSSYDPCAFMVLPWEKSPLWN